MAEAPNLNPVGSSAEELRGVLSDYMEVTQRLQRTHEILQQEVIRLRSELATKDRELERRRRLAALGELAAGVAHEVRNPLGAIQLNSGLLRRHCQDLAPALDLIDKIDAGIRAIDGVVRDTLSLAPRGGALSPRPLRSVLDEAQEVCRPTLLERGVKLSAHYVDPQIEVLSDGAALPRVFVNLIANAAQASPADSRVELHVRPTDNAQVEIRVLDEGAGLPDEVIEKIFDPFFTTKEAGTGLGLTIAHRLVEAHGGTLTAQNRPRNGAEFIVTLPAGSQEHQPAAQVEPTRSGAA